MVLVLSSCGSGASGTGVPVPDDQGAEHQGGDEEDTDTTSGEEGDAGDAGGGDTDGGDAGGGDAGGGDAGGGDAGGGDAGGGDAGGGDAGGGDAGSGDAGGGTPDPAPPVISLNFATDAERAYYQGDFASSFANVRDNAQIDGVSRIADLPAPGTSNYGGFMEILFFSSPSANVRGEATLNVDMQTGATNGNVTGFMGSVLDETMTNQLVNYEGDVTLSGGSLTAVGPGAAGLSMSIDGTLNNGLQSFGVTGELDGYLFGSTGEGLVVSGRSNPLNDDIVTTVDGAEVDGTVTMWGLRD